MKTVNTYIYISVALICFVFTSVPSRAQESVREFSRQGDSLVLKMNLDLASYGSAKKNSSFDIIPVLSSGNESVELPMVTVKGRRNYIDYIRKISFMSERKKAGFDMPYRVVKDGELESLEYRVVLPYEMWMKNADLNITTKDCNCGTARKSVTRQVRDGVVLDALLLEKPYLAYEKPASEGVKSRAMDGESFLDFELDDWVIKPGYLHNPVELARIRDLVGSVYKDNDFTIKNIEVVGYASPEGTLAHNKVLSEKRAKALCDYLSGYWGIPETVFSVKFGGENWDDFLTAMESAPFAGKDAVNEIVRRYSDLDEREAAMKSMGGDTYLQIRDKIFPHLRKAVCRISYSVRDFNVNEVKELINTRPQKLSLSEMFMLANEYEPGSEEFNHIMEVAVRMFPDDDAANLNAANAALQSGHLKEAEKYINRTSYSPKSTNARGVLLALQKKNKAAAELFRQAAAEGCEEALANLRQVE